MNGAMEGDRVKVKYVGKFSDGTVFDLSVGPFAFTVGGGSMVPGFEEAVIGMTPGETRSAVVPAAEAYGPRKKEMIMEVGLDRLPQGLDPEIGDVLEIRLPSGRSVNAVVTDLSQSMAVLDANHPLAGLDLVFEIQMLDIQRDMP